MVETTTVGLVCTVEVRVTGGGVTMMVLGGSGLVMTTAGGVASTTGGGVTTIGGTEVITEEQLRGTCGWPSPI